MNPERCLLPKSEWPKVPPKSKVRASDGEWYSLVKEGFSRGVLGEVKFEDMFRDSGGLPVLNGATGVDKIQLVDGKTVELLRFICLLVPITAEVRRRSWDFGV